MFSSTFRSHSLWPHPCPAHQKTSNRCWASLFLYYCIITLVWFVSIFLSASLRTSTGHRLFSLVQDMAGPLANKITEMLLEIDESELLQLLHCHEALCMKVCSCYFSVGCFNVCFVSEMCLFVCVQVNEALAVYQSYQPMEATQISFTSPVWDTDINAVSKTTAYFFHLKNEYAFEFLHFF